MWKEHERDIEKGWLGDAERSDVHVKEKSYFSEAGEKSVHMALVVLTGTQGKSWLKESWKSTREDLMCTRGYAESPT